MSDTVIKVENLSKQYRIGAKEGYRTFRETLVDAAKGPLALSSTQIEESPMLHVCLVKIDKNFTRRQVT